MTEPSIDKVVEALLTDISGEKQNAPYEVRVDILLMIIASWRERGDALKPFSAVGRLIDGAFAPVLFADEDQAFKSGCAWKENGEAKTLTWGDFRRARDALNSLSEPKTCPHLTWREICLAGESAARAKAIDECEEIARNSSVWFEIEGSKGGDAPPFLKALGAKWVANGIAALKAKP